MKSRTMLFVAAGFTLAGCAAMMGGGTTSTGCTGTCDVSVTVNAGCVIPMPVPEPVRVARGHQVIKWTMSSTTPSQYRFTANGIAFQSGPFTPAPGGGPRVVVMNDDNQGSGTYKYTINVTDGTRNCSLDPTVVNE